MNRQGQELKQAIDDAQQEIWDHEEFIREHIERHISRSLGSICDLINDYETHSRRRSWILSIITGGLAITNIVLIALIITGGIECLSWYGTF